MGGSIAVCNESRRSITKTVLKSRIPIGTPAILIWEVCIMSKERVSEGFGEWINIKDIKEGQEIGFYFGKSEECCELTDIKDIIDVCKGFEASR